MGDLAAALERLPEDVAVERRDGAPRARVVGLPHVRDGVRAHVLDGDGTVRPVADVVDGLLRSLAPSADELRAREALELLRPLLAEGGGAGCQRRAGSPRDAVTWLASTTSA